MARKRLYRRVLHLITPQQDEEIKDLSIRLRLSENEIVRRALGLGLAIIAKLGIDNSPSDGTIDASQQDE